MKKILFFVLVVTSFVSQTNAQGFLDPVAWDVSIEKNTDDLYTIKMEATLDEKWHLYSQLEPEMGEDQLGPIPTEFSYNAGSETFVLVGKTLEPAVAPYYDPIFEMDIIFFETSAVFTQQIQVLHPDGLEVEVAIYYSVCDDKQCLPPESKVFKLGLNTQKASAEVATITEEDIEKSAKLSIPLKGMDQYETEDQEGKTYLTIFFLGFIGGLIALLTPCVFPMIPMTVSFFMKDGSKAKARRNGIIYGLSIVGIYVLIGTLVAVLLGPAFANLLATHWLPNILFFLIFVIFAASFLGAFEIVLPSWIVNKADAQADKGGLTGIFFMAFTIVLVSFSCTGPIVGSILVESAGGAFVKPMVGMLGFSLAFAIPFALFAIFPS